MSAGSCQQAQRCPGPSTGDPAGDAQAELRAGMTPGGRGWAPPLQPPLSGSILSGRKLFCVQGSWVPRVGASRGVGQHLLGSPALTQGPRRPPPAPESAATGGCPASYSQGRWAAAGRLLPPGAQVSPCLVPPSASWSTLGRPSCRPSRARGQLDCLHVWTLAQVTSAISCPPQPD